MAPAKCTLYSLTPVDELTRLLSATVIGIEWMSAKETPKRKSFQILVNCQMTVTTMMGPELGRRMRRKICRKLAPSIIAARTSSVGNASEWLRKKNVGQPI